MIHLHVHSEYSIRDSLIKIPELISFCKDLDMNSIALTDHGNLSGALAFYKECKENDIQPIIGIEAYIVPNRLVKEKGDKRYHLTLLALNREGYQNLLSLGSIAGTEGFYYKPRIDPSLLEDYGDGLIGMSACAFSSILYMTDDFYQFPLEKLFIEIMPHNAKWMREHNFKAQNYAEEHGIELVSTWDSHYLTKEDREAHDILMQIQDRDPYEIGSFYLGTKRETSIRYLRDHKYLPKETWKKAIKKTDEIASLIDDYHIPLEEFEYPEFEEEG